MDQFHIEGVPGYNGAWDLDLSFFTNRELHTIKQIAGLRAGELDTAMQVGDNDLFVALAVIALQRSGKFQTVNVDAIWDAEAGKLTFVADEADLEDDADDPPASLTLTAPAESDSVNEPTDSSGKPSRVVGVDHQETTLASIGSQG